MNKSTSIKQEEKGIMDSAAEIAKDAKNMVSDIVGITKETITEKAHESKMQKPEDKGITGIAAELVKGVGDMVNSAVEGTKEIMADAVEGTKEIVAAHNASAAPTAIVANIQNKPLSNSDAALVKEIQEQHGENVEITITKVTVKGLSGDKNVGNNSSGNSAAELEQDARTMINNAVEIGSVSAPAEPTPAPRVADSAKELAKNVKDVINDAFESTKEIAAEKGLIDSANKLASDVKATIGNAVETTKEKVLQVTDNITDHLSNTRQVGNPMPSKTDITAQMNKKSA
uniref:Uncharacterized protein n=1 Tax=Panagrolaimus davidi TaxID=227884 RepID=A0A914QWP8_9BILA